MEFDIYSVFKFNCLDMNMLEECFKDDYVK